MRPSRLGILLTLVALVATVLAVRVWAPGDDDEPSGLWPSGADERPARTHALPLDERLARTPGSPRSAGRAQIVQTRELDVPAYSMVALTWTGEQTLRGAAVRTRNDGRWSPWQELEALEDLGAEERSGRQAEDTATTRGTEPWWVREADGVQVRVAGRRPDGLELVLIDPGVLRSDAAAAEPGPDEAGPDKPGADEADEEALALSAASRPTHAPRPYLRRRHTWGANESLRTSDPVYSRRLKQVHVHHTATANGYARGDVPAIIRSMYRYHTQSLGWSDIGYNFLVDRFGRAWVGRWGGYRRLVRGAHTLGFNHNSVGIVVIGTYQRREPSRRAITALVRLSAWKLDRHDARPAGWAMVRSLGSDRYREGRWARLPVIDGHRDTNYTACPGRQVYDRLPQVRRRAQNRADYFS